MLKVAFHTFLSPCMTHIFDPWKTERRVKWSRDANWVYTWAVRCGKDRSKMCNAQFPHIPLLLLLKLEVRQSKWGECNSLLQVNSRIQACFSYLAGFLAETCIRFKVYPGKMLKLCVLAFKCTAHQLYNPVDQLYCWYQSSHLIPPD